MFKRFGKIKSNKEIDELKNTISEHRSMLHKLNTTIYGFNDDYRSFYFNGGDDRSFYFNGLVASLNRLEKSVDKLTGIVNEMVDDYYGSKDV